MATEKKFGSPNTAPSGASRGYAWGSIPYYANVYCRAVMPEGGYVTKIKLPIAHYDSSDSPIVWAIIRNRSTGAIIAQSEAKTTWEGYYWTYFPGGSFSIYTINLPRTFIPAGTELWIGFSRVSNQSNRKLAFHYWQPVSGEIIDYNDASQSSPPSIFTPTNSLTDKYLRFEVTYETGGNVKVWNGSSWVVKPLKVYKTGAWLEEIVKAYTGSTWKESNS